MLLFVGLRELFVHAFDMLPSVVQASCLSRNTSAPQETWRSYSDVCYLEHPTFVFNLQRRCDSRIFCPARSYMRGLKEVVAEDALKSLFCFGVVCRSNYLADSTCPACRLALSSEQAVCGKFCCICRGRGQREIVGYLDWKWRGKLQGMAWFLQMPFGANGRVPKCQAVHW